LFNNILHMSHMLSRIFNVKFLTAITLTTVVFLFPLYSHAWDLSSASYDSVYLSVGLQAINPLGMTFKTDGTAVYIANHSTDYVYQYTISTPWDMSTGSYGGVNYYVGGQSSLVVDVEFSSDGTKMYVLDSSDRAVYQYTLSTAWLVSSASYDSVSKSIWSDENSPRGIAFKTDGTKMYISGDSGDEINQYTLSSAWDISTASVGTPYSISEDGSPVDVEFKTDGTKMYVMGYDNDTVFQYSLSSAWDVTTASYDSVSKHIGSQEVTPWDVHIGSSGTKMYIIGNGYDRVYQYTLTPDVTNPTVQSFSPLDNATSVSISGNLVLTFDEVVNVQSGDISVYKTSGDTLVEAIDVTGGLVIGSGSSTISINPTVNFENGTGYYLQIDATAFDDVSGNSFDGIGDSSTWSFTTGTSPTVLSISPEDGASISSTIEFAVTFSEEMDPLTEPRLSASPCNFGGSCARPSGVWSEGNTVFTVSAPEEFVTGITYTMTLNTVSDLDDGLDLAIPFEWSFIIAASGGGIPITPTCSLEAYPLVVTKGNSSSLFVQPHYQGLPSNYYTKLENTGTTYSKEDSDIEVYPMETTEYLLYIINPRGANSCSATVTVENNPEIFTEKQVTQDSLVETNETSENSSVDEEISTIKNKEKEEVVTERVIPTMPFTRTLQRYNKGEDVALLQKILNLLNLDKNTFLEEDGDFGSRTEKAVKSFQVYHDLEEDGVVGRETRLKLNKR
jgi:hypothetical protein